MKLHQKPEKNWKTWKNLNKLKSVLKGQKQAEIKRNLETILR